MSNFNETEQILLLDSQKGEGKSGGSIRGDLRFSYVQTRGSVPVYWAELNNLRYKPDLKIMDLSSTVSATSGFLDSVVADLIDAHRLIPSDATLSNKSLSTEINIWSTWSTRVDTKSPSRRHSKKL